MEDLDPLGVEPCGCVYGRWQDGGKFSLETFDRPPWGAEFLYDHGVLEMVPTLDEHTLCSRSSQSEGRARLHGTGYRPRGMAWTRFHWRKTDAWN